MLLPRILVCAVLLALVPAVAMLAPVPVAPRTAADGIQALMDRTVVRAALAALETQYDDTLEELEKITEIPAPSFKEQPRAKYVAARMREIGLKDVLIDDEGNAIGERPGAGGGPTLVLAAHLDTVFPEGTDVRVRKKGTVWSAPGVGDDSHGLAVMLAIARAVDTAQVRTRGSVLFVADVGEEGLGNLRGIRHLFQKNPARRRLDMFISLDGLGDDIIINGGVASKRYRVTFRGPGGHSFGAFGQVNPAFAMANAVAKFSRFRVPKFPKTTYNVGAYGGGTSVNSIPNAVWMDVDLRSESLAELAKLERQFLAAVHEAAAEENRTRNVGNGRVVAEPRLIGDRKGGVTPMTSEIVQTAMDVTQVLGRRPLLRYGSTDANVPISMGIPAITIGSGGRGDRAHSLDEWVDVDKATTLPGMRRAMLLVLALVGVE